MADEHDETGPDKTGPSETGLADKLGANGSAKASETKPPDQKTAIVEALLELAGDGELFALILGRDERSNQMRQSPPYVGMLSREEVRGLNEEAAS